MADPLGILLVSAAHDRVHAAFTAAAAAAALGRPVTLFATGAGTAALLATWRALDREDRDSLVRARNVAGLDELREAVTELRVRLLACEAGLRAEALLAAPLYAGVEIAGMATFLEAVGSGQIISL